MFLIFRNFQFFLQHSKEVVKNYITVTKKREFGYTSTYLLHTTYESTCRKIYITCKKHSIKMLMDVYMEGIKKEYDALD